MILMLPDLSNNLYDIMLPDSIPLHAFLVDQTIHSAACFSGQQINVRGPTRFKVVIY